MAEFKVGDRVKVIANEQYEGIIYPIGTTGVVSRGNDEPGYGQGTIRVRIEGKESILWTNRCELITDTPTYKPITPKVGERYKVIKKFRDNHFVDLNSIYTIREVVPGEKCLSTNGFLFQSHSTDSQNYLTTEYLELVEEPARKMTQVPRAHWTSLDFRLNMGLDTAHIEPQPIKQSITTKAMNFIKSALLSKEDKTLIKAGYLNEDLLLTSTGKSALEFIVFTANKKQLVTMAEEALAEEKD